MQNWRESGADPGILVRGGGVDFFFKGMGRLKVPSGSREHPGWGLVGEAPGSSGILVNLGVKFNHIISPHE